MVVRPVRWPPTRIEDEPTLCRGHPAPHMRASPANIKTPEDFGRLMGTITGARPGQGDSDGAAQVSGSRKRCRKLRPTGSACRGCSCQSPARNVTAEIRALAATLRRTAP